jgi:carboxypeptidase Q
MMQKIMLGFCMAAMLLGAMAGPAMGQLPAEKPAPFSQIPQGEGACAVGKTCADVAPGMIARAQEPGPLEENLRQLTDVIGGRVSGGVAANQAAAWAVNAMKQAGIEGVHTEEFTIPVGWSEGNTSVRVLDPEAFPVRAVSNPWVPATSAGGITTVVVDVGKGDEAGFAKAAGRTKGAIMLVRSSPLVTWDDLLNESLVNAEIEKRAEKAGAAAIFWMSTRPNLLLYRHTLTVDGTLAKLPQAIVAREDALRMERFLAAGVELRVHLELPNQVTGPVKSLNVVGEIRGREKPEEFVILGAHLDSWELGTGALDNGCNAAMVIDAARVINGSGSIPRRSIRFVLFTGKEQGLLGSEAYAQAHRAELDQMVAAVIFDAGTGRTSGYSLGGRKDVAEAVHEAILPAESLGKMEQTLDAKIGTDNLDFLLEGVPTLVANQEPANYMLNYHAASDTFDKVNFKELMRNTALAAVTAYGLADAEQRIGKRQTRAEIEPSLHETGLDMQMKRSGLWPAWADGPRGRKQ